MHTGEFWSFEVMIESIKGFLAESEWFEDFGYLGNIF